MPARDPTWPRPARWKPCGRHGSLDGTVKNPLVRDALLLILVIVYVAAVLAIDTLAVHGKTWPVDWRFFQWRAYSADLFKFIAWFVVPFLVCLPRMDWGYLGVKRWRRFDLYVLAGLAAAGALAVAVIPLFPSLRATYPSMAGYAAAAKWSYAGHNLLWILSWLLGWEFLHRYFLLTPLVKHAPRYGWLLIPVSEGLYHLQKPPLEAAGMVLASLAITYWALKRRNALLPFLAHFMIEIELVAFRLVV